MKEMTGRQRFNRMIYPLLMKATNLFGKNNGTFKAETEAEPDTSFYSLTITLNDGSVHSLQEYEGRKILLVNTASDCGYTRQYEGLQELYKRYAPGLVVIGFPANDFKEQEKGSDEEIASFCKLNYGVSFPLVSKSSVVKGPEQHPVFAWLSHANKNGWNNQEPVWNFSKYLVNAQGRLTHFFEPSVDPFSPELIKAIEKK